MKVITREDYTPEENLFSEKTPKTPWELFEKWYQKAEKMDPNTANIMVISTLGKKNILTQRVVLLKEIENKKLIFYTNYESTKGQDLAENPVISALFYWEKFKIQVHLQGTVTKTSREKSVEYFQTRPLGSRIDAWISKQSAMLESYEDLVEKEKKEMKNAQQNPSLYDQPPKHWGGYAIAPQKWEFWQGQPNRLHQRLCYRLGDQLENDKTNEKNWDIYRLYP